MNEGELPSYYIERSHEPIIVPDEFDAVQAEIQRRKTLGRPVSCQSPFATKIKRGDCGAFFGSKAWGSNTPYRRVIWRCNDRYNKRGKRNCKTSHVTEEDVKARFVEAFNKLMANRDSLIDDCRLALATLCDTTQIDAELAELEREVEVVEELSRKAIDENARNPIDQSAWVKRNGVYLKRHDEATERIEELDALKDERIGKSKTIAMFMKSIQQQGPALTEFDESLWAAVIEYVVVGVDGRMTFRFNNEETIIQ